MTEDEMVGCHHWLNDYELEKTQEMVKDREVWCAAGHGVAVRYNLATEQQVPQRGRSLIIFLSLGRVRF